MNQESPVIHAGECQELAIKSNGIIVNISDDEGDGIIDFVCDLSDAAYKGELEDQNSDILELKKLIVENPSGNFDKIVNCGFAP